MPRSPAAKPCSQAIGSCLSPRRPPPAPITWCLPIRSSYVFLIRLVPGVRILSCSPLRLREPMWRGFPLRRISSQLTSRTGAVSSPSSLDQNSSSGPALVGAVLYCTPACPPHGWTEAWFQIPSPSSNSSQGSSGGEGTMISEVLGDSVSQ